MTTPHPLEKAIHDYLATHQKWVEQTQEELRVLRTRDFKQATEVLPKKKQISEAYERQLKFLHERRKQLQDLPLPLANQLRTADQEFKTIGAELKDELDMTVKMADALKKVISRAVTRKLKTSFFYGRSGSLLDNVAPRSVTINKSA